MSCCITCNTDPCCCCGDEAPVMDLATYPPVESTVESEADECPDQRFYDISLYEFVVPATDSSNTVTLHVCDSTDYFAGMYISVFDGASYVGLFRVVDVTGPTTIRASNTGIDSNQPAGYTAAAGSYIIVAQPPETIGTVGEANIENDSICTQHIGDGCITNPKIADGAVNTQELADNAVTTGKILDGTITEADLGFIPFTSWLGTNYYTGGYTVPITALANTPVQASLQIVTSLEVGDVLIAWSTCNMYSPNCYLIINQVAGTAICDEHQHIVHANDSSTADKTSLFAIAAWKCTTAGTITVNLTTGSLPFSAGLLGQIWLSAIRLRSNPGS